ncbi:MAG: radical SAM protein [Bacteriovoracaceae bacterium]|nr:radical SAM protein [Bacteriovoracaceae bacterium]
MTKLCCPLLYNHLSIDNTGKRMFCCLATYSKTLKSGDEVFSPSFEIQDIQFDYDKEIEEAREAFKKGQFPPQCHVCKYNEENEIKSYRQDNLDIFPQTTELIRSGREDKVSIEYLDIKLGNNCNLKCRMCNPTSSSGLTKEHELIYPGSSEKTKHLSFDWYKDPKRWDEFFQSASSLKYIQFTGGEPFLINEMWIFLKKLVEEGYSKNIHLKFNTNFTHFKDEFYKIFLEFKEVTLYLSIDGIEDVFEYIRYPGKWDDVHSNFKRLDDLMKTPNSINTVFFPSIQINNVFQIEKLFEYIKSFQNIKKNIDLNMVHYPKAFSISNLPDSIKNELKLNLLTKTQDLVQTLNSPPLALKSIKDVLNLLSINGDKEELREFIRINQIYDKNRSQNTKDCLPQGWFNKILDAIS